LALRCGLVVCGEARARGRRGRREVGSSAAPQSTHLPHEGHVQVGVGVDAAGHHQLAGGVDHLGALGGLASWPGGVGWGGVGW
jgi:hypothetical protein